METQKKLGIILLETLEQYCLTSIELVKLKAIAKITGIVSQLISRLVFIIILLLGLVMLNIAGALWLGDLLGKNYYGFLIITLVDGIIGVLVFIMHPTIKSRIGNAFISHLIN
jgi:hypothetical protein